MSKREIEKLNHIRFNISNIKHSLFRDLITKEVAIVGLAKAEDDIQIILDRNLVTL